MSIHTNPVVPDDGDSPPNEFVAPPRRRRRLLTAALFVALLALWWFTLGPLPLGGHATFAVVDGSSMEPTLQGGDLVVARTQPSYDLGDLVVFPVAGGRVVIHRIMGGSAESGWITQGDNNDRLDDWVVPDDRILGRAWVEVPDVGGALLWTREHPLVFGAVVAAVVLVSGIVRLLARRRSRLHPLLADAVASGRRTSRRAGRPVAEVLAFVSAGVAMVVAAVAVVVLAAVGVFVSAAGLFAGVLLVAGTTVFLVLFKRLGDGWRVPEPDASRYALSGLCWEVAELPVPESVVECPTAVDLRHLAERLRLPVLRCSRPEGDDYLTISREGVGYRWRAFVTSPPGPPARDTVGV